MLEPCFAVLVTGWVIERVEATGVVRIVGEDVVACLQVESVPLRERYTGDLTEHALGDFLPILLVVAPLAPGGLIPVHQDTQSPSLKLVKVRHKPAFFAVPESPVGRPVIDKHGRFEGFDVFGIQGAKAIQSLLEEKVVNLGHEEVLIGMLNHLFEEELKGRGSGNMLDIGNGVPGLPQPGLKALHGGPM